MIEEILLSIIAVIWLGQLPEFLAWTYLFSVIPVIIWASFQELVPQDERYR